MLKAANRRGSSEVLASVQFHRGVAVWRSVESAVTMGSYPSPSFHHRLVMVRSWRSISNRRSEPSTRGRGASTVNCSISRPRPSTRNRVGEVYGLRNAVGDKHDGAPRLGPDVHKLATEPRCSDLIEMTERLVHQDQFRISSQAHGRSIRAAAVRPKAAAEIGPQTVPNPLALVRRRNADPTPHAASWLPATQTRRSAAR